MTRVREATHSPVRPRGRSSRSDSAPPMAPEDVRRASPASPPRPSIGRRARECRQGPTRRKDRRALRFARRTIGIRTHRRRGIRRRRMRAGTARASHGGRRTQQRRPRGTGERPPPRTEVAQQPVWGLHAGRAARADRTAFDDVLAAVEDRVVPTAFEHEERNSDDAALERDSLRPTMHVPVPVEHQRRGPLSFCAQREALVSGIGGRMSRRRQERLGHLGCRDATHGEVALSKAHCGSIAPPTRHGQPTPIPRTIAVADRG